MASTVPPAPIPVQFWCLQALHDAILLRYSSLPPADLALLRSSLLSLASDCPFPPSSPTFLRNKLACLLIALDDNLLNQDYPRSPAEAAAASRVTDSMCHQCVPQIADKKIKAACVAVLLTASLPQFTSSHTIYNDRFIPGLFSRSAPPARRHLPGRHLPHRQPLPNPRLHLLSRLHPSLHLLRHRLPPVRTRPVHPPLRFNGLSSSASAVPSFYFAGAIVRRSGRDVVSHHSAAPYQTILSAAVSTVASLARTPPPITATGSPPPLPLSPHETKGSPWVSMGKQSKDR